MAILELMRAAGKRDRAWLCAALQAAVELEFFTIPPYLTAMWSICDQKHPAAATLRAVVYEEMEHMALACNMLAAVGGTPVLNRPPAVPAYPRPLPGGVKPHLTVSLCGLTRDLVGVFMQIEEPEEVLKFPEALLRLPETFPRIGAFYEAVRQTFRDLRPPLSVDRQLTGPLAPLVVASLEDVDRAVGVIRRQGEGTDVSPAADSPTELAHYYRFQELQKGKKLEYDPQQKTYRWGAKFDFPEVYPVAPVPAGGYRYEEVAADVAGLLRTFDGAYTRLLDELNSAWGSGGQAALWRAVEAMFSLAGPARALMALPIPGTNPPLHYGPNFRYVAGR